MESQLWRGFSVLSVNRVQNGCSPFSNVSYVISRSILCCGSMALASACVIETAVGVSSSERRLSYLRRLLYVVDVGHTELYVSISKMTKDLAELGVNKPVHRTSQHLLLESGQRGSQSFPCDRSLDANKRQC